MNYVRDPASLIQVDWTEWPPVTKTAHLSPSSQLLIIHVIEESINVNDRRLPHLGLSSLPQQHPVTEMETTSRR
ncbi:hypothetical protein H8959_000704, partial [Pygathrix nigripes]